MRHETQDFGRRVRLRASAGCAALLWLFAIGCGTTPKPAPKVQYPDYKVGAPDRLSVTILPDPVVAEQVTVRPDGKITIQLVGDVQAGGRTTQEISTEIEERIARYKRGAVVTVSLAAAQSSVITVVGEVRGPTALPLVRQMRVSEALASVGDITSFANEDEVRVVRPGLPPQVLYVDIQRIRVGDLSSDIQLYGGDIVYVPPTLWAQLGYAIQAVLFPFQPFLGIGNSVAGRALLP